MSRLKPMNPLKRIVDGQPVPIDLSARYRLKDVDLAFDPSEKRDSHGRWSKVAGEVDAIEKLIGGTPSTTVTAEQAMKAKATQKKVRASHEVLTQLSDEVSSYEFNQVIGYDSSENEQNIRDIIKAHPEVLDSPRGKAILKYHPELSGRKPDYADVAKDYDFYHADKQGGFPQDKASIHEEHVAQINAEFWHDAMPEDAPEEEHYARSLWEQYQNPHLYGSINHTLRTGEQDTENSGPTADVMRHYVDVMFDKAGTTTEAPMTLYRALHSSNQPQASGVPDWAEKLKPGTVFTDKGIMSCTAHGKFAQGWLNLDATGQEVDAEKADDVVMEIRVPAGQRIVGGSAQFIETMLPPNTPLRIISNERRRAKTPVNPLGGVPEDPFDYTHVVAEVVK